MRIANGKKFSDPMLSSTNNYPSFRSDVAFNCQNNEQKTSPRFNQSRGTNQENIEPNTLKSSIRSKSSSNELAEVKSLLTQSLNELEVKNHIIQKFTEFRDTFEQVKNEEISRIQAMYEEQAQKDNELYKEEIDVLTHELDHEK
jgi:hypothetical protein